jgi:hypothetical protein
MENKIKEIVNAIESIECRLDDVLDDIMQEEMYFFREIKEMLEHYSQDLLAMRKEIATIPSTISYYEEQREIANHEDYLMYI